MATSLLTGQLDISATNEFTMVLSFGYSLHQALVSLSQSLSQPFHDHRQRFVEQWSRAADHLRCEPVPQTGDDGNLYRVSHCLILAHEDKVYDGATIASLSTPWGEAMSDEDLGGYHLVWTRDMCDSATGLMAAGHTTPPLRALIYLACSQCPDGGFYQNFWISGEPYWRGVQLDEVSFPIMLAWRLHEAGGLDGFDPWPMVRNAAGYVIEHGPATMQERWEENGGYSPSTLASNIAGLVLRRLLCPRRATMKPRPDFLEDYADFLESHVDRWTVTTEGELVPGIRRHYIRIHPVALGDPHADEDPNHGWIELRNQPPGVPAGYPAKNIVDAGFLELVRYGIRAGQRPDRGFAARDRCHAAGRYSLRTLLASLQQRWLWPEARWRTLSRVGARTCLALVDGRTRALRIGGRTQRHSLHSRHGKVRHADGALTGAGLGSASYATVAVVLRPRDGRRDAARVGARRVHQAGAARRPMGASSTCCRRSLTDT